MSLPLLKVQLRMTSRSVAVRSALLYLVVTPTSSVFSNLVGSISEYRFPHTLATTTLHLLISLISLILFKSLVSLLKLRQSRRNVHRRQLSSSEPQYLDQSPTKRSIQSYLTPQNIASTLLSTLSALIQSQSYHTIHYSSSSNTLPIPLLIIVSTFKNLSNTIGVSNFSLPLSISSVVGLVLFLGEGMRSWTDETGSEAFSRWILLIGYAVGVSGWVLAIKMGMNEEVTSNHSPPTVIYHLTSTLALFVPALLLSGELGNIYRSGHFGFFTEIGFWLQEIVIALCGLAKLLAFWDMVKKLDPITIFAIVGLKDRYLPHLYSFLFGNPASIVTGSSILSPIQQSVVLLIVGVYCIVDWGLRGVRIEDNVRGIDSRSKVG